MCTYIYSDLFPVYDIFFRFLRLLKKQKFLILIKSILSVFLFIFTAYILLKNCILSKNHKEFFSRISIVVLFINKSMNQLESLLAYGVE